MRKVLIPFFSIFLAVALFSTSVVSCYAVSDEYTSTGNFWQAVADKWYTQMSILPPIIGHLSDDVCAESSDHKHHGRLKSYKPNGDGAFTAVCDYCSSEFLEPIPKLTMDA